MKFLPLTGPLRWPRSLLTTLVALTLCLTFGGAARAFCGFYVAKADAELFNNASQVILARDGERTVVTMSNDYEGDLDEFAIVVPVPVVLEEEQVHVGEQAIIDRLDAFTAPRLVEYFDPDPCAPVLRQESFLQRAVPNAVVADVAESESVAGVTVEATFSVGEYDIVILSATESDGLETWLRQNDYQIPDNAQPLLRPYIRQGMKFFLAKVNLEEFERSGSEFLRPIQIAYNSSKFMLPIRLGMANARGDQDLIVYGLSPQGQVELTNYRTVQVPSNMDIPVFVKSEFDDFYTDMFETAYERENKNVAFLEYAWDIRTCDPCSAPTPSTEELRDAGVFWVNPNQSPDAFVTRLHVRYGGDHFPEDLMFQETNNRQNFQGRYVLRHPFEGEAQCSAGREYRRSLPERFEQEAQTLARLTRWDINDIRDRQPSIDESTENEGAWWEDLWGD